MAGVAVVLVGLTWLGLDVEDRLKPTSLEVPGTESARADELLREHFGPSAPFAILLEGPTSRLDEQGPRLVDALRAEPGVTTLSPWDRGVGTERLRPTNQEALILVDFHVSNEEAVRETVPELDRILDREISEPVEATSTGFATISKAIQDRSIDATRRAELIAIPVLLVVLLLVFRSPVAAAIPLVFGGFTVLASRGVITLSSSVIDVDGFALAACSMMGLALGVDYALLMVSRFREELAGGADAAEAAWMTRATAGRTTIFAGTTLFISMLLSVFVLPGALLVSLAGTIVIVTALSVGVAVIAGPALLTLLGPGIDRWEFGSTERRQAGLMSIVSGALRRPAPIAALIGAFLALMAVPALALDTGPPSTEQLPRDDPARADAAKIRDAIGPGWGAPFILVAAAEDGSVASRERLEALARSQDEIASEEGVRLVIGPGQIASRTAPLRDLSDELFGDEERRRPGLSELAGQLSQASVGVQRLREGLGAASAGASALAAGTADAGEGADAISAGLSQAASGSIQAESALAQFATVTRQLAKAEQRALLGTLALKFGLTDLGANLRRNPLPRARRLDTGLSADIDEVEQLRSAAADAETNLEDAWARLQAMTVGQTDPEYPAAEAAVRDALSATSGTDPVTLNPYAAGYDGLPAELAALRTRIRDYSVDADEVANWLVSIDNALKRLRSGAVKLYDGTLRLKRGTKRLAAGAAAFAGEAPELTNGLAQLDAGLLRLATGIDAIGSGADALAAGLSEAFLRTRPLAGGLKRADVRVQGVAPQVDRLRRDSPGFFDSSFFVLSALDGAEEAERSQAAQSIDLERGGRAALMFIVPAYGFNSDGSIRLNDTLRGKADELAEETGLQTAIAGGAAQLSDYDQVTTARIPLVIAAITLITFLAMIAILRAVPLAALAVALNLVSVAAAFGILSALSHVPEGLPLGGRTYLDAIGAAAIFGVVFGLSIDYAVFLLMRMRESYERDGDHLAAITYGLERTALVITGAAAIMSAVFIAFAGASVATVSQMGVGLTVAVILDATVIRLILLPALMRLIGERVWWLPDWLDRRLPHAALEGPAR